MTPAFAARLSPAQQRALAVALLVAGRRRWRWPCCWCRSLLLHQHYDDAIADITDRLERYRRVAAQAPELPHGARCDAREGRPPLLPQEHARRTSPAPSCRSWCKAAIESNGGRITTSQNHGAARRRALPADRRQRAVLRHDARAAEDPVRARDAAAVPRRRQHDAAAAQCVPRLQARAPGRSPRSTCSSTSSAFAFAEPAKNPRTRRARPTCTRRASMNALDRACAAGSSGCVPFAVLAWSSAGRPTGAARSTRVPGARRRRSRRSRSSSRCCRNTSSTAAPTRNRETVRAHAVQSDAPSGAAGDRRGRRSRQMQRGQFALTGTTGHRRQGHGLPARGQRRQVAPRASRATTINGMLVAEVQAGPRQADAGRRVRGAGAQGRHRSEDDRAARAVAPPTAVAQPGAAAAARRPSSRPRRPAGSAGGRAQRRWPSAAVPRARPSRRQRSARRREQRLRAASGAAPSAAAQRRAASRRPRGGRCTSDYAPRQDPGAMPDA